MTETPIAKAFIEIGVKGGGSELQGNLDRQKGIFDRFYKGVVEQRGKAFATAAHGGDVASRAGGAFSAIAGGGGLRGVGAAIGGTAGIVAGGAAAALGAAAVASPVEGERFARAVRDTVAVIGRAFVPALENATKIVRLFGDFFANALPDTKDLFAAISQVIDVVRPAFMAVAGLVKDVLIVALEALAKAINEVVNFMNQPKRGKYYKNAFGGVEKGEDSGISVDPTEITKEEFERGVREGKRGYGVIGFKAAEDEKSSLGAGDFRTPGLVGIAEAKNAFMTEALRVSSGMKDPAEETAKNTEAMKGTLESIKENTMRTGPGEFVGALLPDSWVNFAFGY